MKLGTFYIFSSIAHFDFESCQRSRLVTDVPLVINSRCGDSLYGFSDLVTFVTKFFPQCAVLDNYFFFDY